MSVFLQELLEAMAAELDACSRLLELGKTKKEQLIHNRVNELNVTVRAEAESVKKLKSAAKRRQEALKGIALERGIQGEVSFDAVLGLLTPDKRAEAEQGKLSLKKSVEELSALNALNQRLIETQIQYTEFCINVLTGGSQGLDTYENTGHMKAESPAFTSLIDTKA